jgi:hypothetical protein
MPRVNWYLSPEAKAIFEAYKSEKGLGQDDAANALILEFDKLHYRLNGPVAVDSSGKIIKGSGPIIGVAMEDSKPCPDGKHHLVKVQTI